MLYSVAKPVGTAEFESHLIDLIYGSLLDQEHWQTFVSAIRGIYPNGHGTLFFHDKGTNRGMYAITSGFDRAWAADYQRRYSSLSPWMENISKRPLGLGAPAEYTVPRTKLLKSEFYQHYLKPQGLITGVGMTVTQEADKLLMLSVIGADVDENDRITLAGLFTRLGPHIRRVIGLHRRAGTDPLASVRPLIDSLDVGVAVVDQNRRILHASHQARTLLSSGRTIRLDARGRLVIDAESAMELLSSLLQNNWQRRSTPRTASFHLQDRDGIPYRLTLIGGGRDAVASYFDGPRAFLVVEDLNRPVRIGPELLRAFYGLSLAEAALLVSLADGMTPQQIAVAREVSHETIRSQLKSAYAKLGVARQVDAVRLVCRLGYSVVAPEIIKPS